MGVAEQDLLLDARSGRAARDGVEIVVFGRAPHGKENLDGRLATFSVRRRSSTIKQIHETFAIVCAQMQRFCFFNQSSTCLMRAAQASLEMVSSRI